MKHLAVLETGEDRDSQAAHHTGDFVFPDIDAVTGLTDPLNPGNDGGLLSSFQVPQVNFKNRKPLVPALLIITDKPLLAENGQDAGLDL